MSISFKTSDKITGEEKPPFCWKKVTLKVPVVILPAGGKDSLRIKPKQKKAESRDWCEDWCQVPG